MNTLTIAGHLGKDPETRFTTDGKKVINLLVATTVRKGSQNETTIWWRVTFWGDRFDRMLPYLKKGSAVIVVGELMKADIYHNKEGKPQVSLEVTGEILRFSPFGKSDKEGAGAPQGASKTEAPSASPFTDSSSKVGTQPSWAIPDYGATNNANSGSKGFSQVPSPFEEAMKENLSDDPLFEEEMADENSVPF